jgi:hypothetical protein
MSVSPEDTKSHGFHDVYIMLALALPKPEKSNRSSGLIRNLS